MKAIINQSIVPAIRNMKDFDQLLKTDYEFLVLLNAHIAQVKPLVRRAAEQGKKMFLHADLIEGLKSDEYATEFLAQEIGPAGIISTRNNVVLTAKRKGLLPFSAFLCSIPSRWKTAMYSLKKRSPITSRCSPALYRILSGSFWRKRKSPCWPEA